MTKEYTHSQLVKRAIKWLWAQLGCAVVISEMVSRSQEPDAIGFYPTYSILIECKISRSDFFNEKNKPHFRNRRCMGNKRYYLAPPGMIQPEELPFGWGLMEPTEKRIKIIKDAEWNLDKNHVGEIGLLVSAMRRIRGIKPIGVSVRTYSYTPGWGANRATLGIKPCEIIKKPMTRRMR